jgi:hypothetical protein
VGREVTPCSLVRTMLAYSRPVTVNGESNRSTWRLTKINEKVMSVVSGSVGVYTYLPGE